MWQINFLLTWARTENIFLFLMHTNVWSASRKQINICAKVQAHVKLVVGKVCTFSKTLLLQVYHSCWYNSDKLLFHLENVFHLYIVSLRCQRRSIGHMFDSWLSDQSRKIRDLIWVRVAAVCWAIWRRRNNYF